MHADRSFAGRLSRALTLIPAAAEAAALTADRVAERAALLLALPPQPLTGAGGGSGLNADGSPLQLCLTLGRCGHGWRVVADPASDTADADQRLARSTGALQCALDAFGAAALRPAMDRLLRRWGPNPERPAARFDRGVIWLAADVSGDGVAAYVDSSVLPEAEAMDLARTWLGEELAAVPPLLDLLQPLGRLYSVGIEGRSPADARFKLYLRFNPGVSLDRLGPQLPFHRVPGVASALAEIMGNRAVDSDGVLLCVGFAAEGLTDAKLDLSGVDLALEGADLDRILDRCQSLLSLATPPKLETLMRDHRLAVSFVGVGCTRRGDSRLNVYLKPGLSQAGLP